jgi:hypothetical protein
MASSFGTVMLLVMSRPSHRNRIRRDYRSASSFSAVAMSCNVSPLVTTQPKVDAKAQTNAHSCRVRIWEAAFFSAHSAGLARRSHRIGKGFLAAPNACCCCCCLLLLLASASAALSKGVAGNTGKRDAVHRAAAERFSASFVRSSAGRKQRLFGPF